MPNTPDRPVEDVIADALLGDEDFFTSVDPEFAAASDAEYGEWAGDRDGVDPDEDFPDDTAAVYPVEGGGGPGYTPQASLERIGNLMSSTEAPVLLSPTGRGAYVDPGHDEDDLDAAPEAAAVSGGPAAALPDSGRTPRRRLVDWSKRSHRYAVLAAAATVVVVATLIAMPGDSDRDSTRSGSTTTAPFTVPTMTTTAPAPTTSPALGGPDGPIGIKRADSRCTAGSTDPMQAFDNDLGTAWMCVPAYGVPGTVLRLEFDSWYMVSGACLVPGWNRVNPDGSDEWIKHKTVATVEYQFNDPDETRLTQQTNNLRDEVCTPVQPPVLASAMTITITDFGTPTGAVANTTDVPGQGGIIASDRPVTGDLRDFAVSSIRILGHRAS